MPSSFLHSRSAGADFVPAVIFVFVLLAASKWPLTLDTAFASVERFGCRIARRTSVATTIVALSPLLLRLCMLRIIPVPVPGIHDEFSYLLASDTFAHGRLTNPTHPMWIFFETVHVNQLPTYMSKYPPAQGAMLAIGQVLGHPWIGVLASVAVMSVAVLWMLRGWLPQRWAFLGALFVALRLGGFSYWANSYWGGAVSAIGGALVMGAVPRIMRSPRRRDAILLALGVSILANTRPLEGFILCAAVLLALGVVSRRGAPENLGRFLSHALPLPAILILLTTSIFMGYYNWRGTHDVFLFPYAVNDQAYGNAPNFIWQRASAPRHSENPQLESLFAWERSYWDDNRSDSVRHFAHHVSIVAIKFTYFFLWPQFVLPFAAAVFLVHDLKVRFFLATFLFCFLGMIVVVWSQPHYAAPLTAAIFFLITQSLRHLRQWRYRGAPVGLGLVRAIGLFGIAMTLVYIASAARNPSLSSFVATSGVWANPANQARAKVLQELEALPDKHLVVVRYPTGFAETGEWVYNRADIDDAKVVWAREIPGVDTKPLLSYFSSRHVWLLEPKFSPPHLRPF